MRIISITCARNEEDIIEAFIRHHIKIVDRMFIILHCCADGTKRILEDLQAEGMDLCIHEEDEVSYKQKEFLNALMERIAHDENATWIIPLDADEFLIGINQEPQNILANAKQEVLSIPWRPYVPLVSNSMEEVNVLKRITNRVVTDAPMYRKVIVPGKMQREQKLRLTLGSHAIQDATGAHAPEMRFDDLMLAHFPARSPEQLMNKVLLGWLSHASNPHRKEGDIFHWQTLFTEFTTKGMPSPERVHDIARLYALSEETTTASLITDPVPCTFTLRYTNPLPEDLWKRLHHSTLSVAEELPKARKDKQQLCELHEQQ